MAGSNHLRRNVFIGLALAAVTLAVYWPAIRFEFINYDDNIYIIDNDHVTTGITAQNVAWSLTSGYASNWHPLTWMSHMLDCQLYGLHPAGHHLTNLLFHAANTLLLFALFLQLTAKPWRSAFIAALFAWHPMHVESVAWISERKDVLSTFFGLLTLVAYTRHAKGPKSNVYYILALPCFALALMAKPMMVTLPGIMLLLDFWPLGRLQTHSPGRLLAEKVPFIVLALLSCVVTFWVQKVGGAMVLTHLPLGERLANALVAYMRYIGKLLWQRNMAILYPYRHDLPLWEVLGSALALGAISILTLCGARKRPYLAVGWFWFVLMLAPVIGLVQVGEQSMADRYTYLPATGLFLLLTWTVAEALAATSAFKWAMGGAAAVLLAACLFITSHQLQYWQNSITLFTHALRVTRDNPTPHDNLGSALIDEGKYDEAVAEFMKALKLRPKWDSAHNNLGIALLAEGKLQGAISNFQTAIELKPDYGHAMVNLGIALSRQGKWDEAIAQYRNALNISPDADAENRLGGALESQGKYDEAASHYEAALRIKSDFPEAHNNLAAILNTQGKFASAREHLLAALKSKPDLAAAHYNLANTLAGLEEPDAAATEYLTALRLRPEDPQTHFNLANLMAREKKWDQAMLHYSAALRLQPTLTQADINLAIILSQQGRIGEAIDHYRTALHSDAHAVLALKNLAWILATNPDSRLRDGAEALRLSTLAIQLAPADATVWDTQAAACAEVRQFSDAVSAAQKALDLAKASQDKEWLVQMQKRLSLYEAGQAFHENPGRTD